MSTVSVLFLSIWAVRGCFNRWLIFLRIPLDSTCLHEEEYFFFFFFSIVRKAPSAT
jgi:hypothetical protein